MHADAPESAGFTLVETIVALVILSACLLAFYQFLGSAINGAIAVERAGKAYDFRQNALSIATVLNPMQMPEGSVDLGTYRIRWHSETLLSPRQSSGFPNGKGQFTIALYRVVLDFPGERGIPPVEVTKLGFRRMPGPVGEGAN